MVQSAPEQFFEDMDKSHLMDICQEYGWDKSVCDRQGAMDEAECEKAIQEMSKQCKAKEPEYPMLRSNQQLVLRSVGGQTREREEGGMEKPPRFLAPNMKRWLTLANQERYQGRVVVQTTIGEHTAANAHSPHSTDPLLLPNPSQQLSPIRAKEFHSKRVYKLSLLTFALLFFGPLVHVLSFFCFE